MQRRQMQCDIRHVMMWPCNTGVTLIHSALLALLLSTREDWGMDKYEICQYAIMVFFCARSVSLSELTLHKTQSKAK